jgi:acetoacetate decarboxylase
VVISAEALPRVHYPPPPWKLRGSALHAVHLVRREQAAASLPPPVRAVPVVPGRTPALLFLASYASGSTLRYHELIVAIAARCRASLGFWIAHIYVDEASSVAGGREIWGLPKQLASFDWDLESSGEVRVRQGERLLCALRCHPPRLSLPLPLYLPVLSRVQSRFCRFEGHGRSALSRSSASVQVPADCPFSTLGFQRSTSVFHHRALELAVGAPRPLAC